MRRLTFMIFCHPVDPNGALTQLWAGTSPETEEFNGKVLISLPIRSERKCSEFITFLTLPIVRRALGEVRSALKVQLR